ncbi:MAG: putative Ig domain-containing protein [Methylococcales bacterium]
MKRAFILMPLLALSTTTQAGSIRGALGNFDAINETGEVCYGIEIELDDAHSKDVVSTYPGNHYGYGKIREDLSDPAHPKVFVRYEAPVAKGLQTGFTKVPVGTPASCYDLAKNVGCEHFGVHFSYTNSNPYSAVKYNWLVKDTNGKVVVGPSLNMGAPTFVYTPPVIGFAAQVVATMPAPVVPQPVVKEFGEPSWVKVIKTKTHKTKPLTLGQLISIDTDNDGKADWTNGEAPEVESEWYLMQTRSNGSSAKTELAGKPDSLGSNGDEAVTRRYEFYGYAGPAASIDGENGEAMCDVVGADNVFGEGIVEVTDANGNSQQFDCSTVPVVGDYHGAQMTEFVAVSPFSMVDALQNGNVNELFPSRPLADGGNTPYTVKVTTGALPNGLTVNQSTGLLSGVPTKVGVFSFTASSSDFDGSSANKSYTIKVTGPGDTDADNDIDLADLNVIKAKYGQLVAAKDPADVNGDLRVNIADYRKAASLCTKPQCALVTPAP